MGIVLLLLMLAAAAIALFAFRRASRMPVDGGRKIHSRPLYHAINAAIWTGVPAAVFLLLWVFVQGSVIDNLVLTSVPGREALGHSNASILMSEIHQLAAGNIFKQPTLDAVAAAERYKAFQNTAFWAMAALAASLAVIGAFFGLKVIGARYPARHSVERSATWFMLFSSIIAIITTVGIIASLLFEAANFFSKVPIAEFLFGLRWEPQIAIRSDQVAGQGAFGVIPVIYGTIVISLLAMAVAVPIGILSAIYLTEYAHPKLRAFIKPMLEILAGVPTVVYGFFAVLTVAPAVRSLGLSLGLEASPNSALAAGMVMGVMIIPLISSLSDDAFAAVPRTMRDGSFALGATQGETIRKVLLPAALPGIVGGVLLALSRAIGETMIVVMAAGLIARITLNPFDAVTTVTVQIVTLLTGDAEFDNPKTLAAFALGLVLFIITLILNMIALTTVRKYREKY